MLDAVYYMYIYIYIANIYIYINIYFDPYHIICGKTNSSALFFPFIQNQKNIANKITSPESLYDSYNQTLLLTQTL